MSATIGARRIGDGSPCYITFEAGPTHDGLPTALELIRQAAKAKADAVKFQLIDPDRLVANRKQPFTYSVLVDRASGRMEEVSEPLYDILTRRCLAREEWRRLKDECDRLSLAFFCTASFPEEIDFLARLGCHSIKISSGDVNHLPLIRRAARTGLCIQLDTGGATLGEVEAAVDAVLGEGNENIIIHHCPSGYPACLEGINLRTVPTFKRLFEAPVAFSDHSPGSEMDIAALALGANMLEKTITLDRMTRSVEHVFSLEPEEMGRFVQSIRDMEIALGSTRRRRSEAEKKLRVGGRRSCFFAADVTAGQVLTEEIIDFRRPGTGIAPTELGAILGCKATAAKSKGAMITWQDLG